MIRWLYPGMRVKRWFGLSLLGLLLIICGLAFLIGTTTLSRLTFWLHSITEKLTMPYLRIAGFTLIVLGFVLFYLGLHRLINSLFRAVNPQSNGGLADAVFSKRVMEKGPRIVVFGGGSGLSTILRGLKEYTSNITAVVTMTDDGGSSGRLRNDLGILPPGDIRNCLVALADCEPITQSLFQYRFKQSEELVGHNFGNLFIAALTKIAGDFETALYYASQVLAVRGRVLPSTLTDCTLVADDGNGNRVEGESQIPLKKCKIKNVSLEPKECPPHPDILEAIAQADLIILGPGSLYTSLIPNLLVDKVPEAIRKSKAQKFYICNIMTQQGETDNYTASQHLEAIKRHAGHVLVDYIIVNNKTISPKIASSYGKEAANQVLVDLDKLKKLGVDVIEAPLLDENDVVRHNPHELARLIMEILLRYQGKKENLIFKFVPIKGWHKHESAC